VARAVSKPNSVSDKSYLKIGQWSFIYGCKLPCTSCDLPGNLDGLSSNIPLFGLAPSGVYKASSVTRRTGALLPHLFTLTCLIAIIFLNYSNKQAVYFLLHFPSRYRDSTLWSTLPCGVRTFLRVILITRRSLRLLQPFFLINLL